LLQTLFAIQFLLEIWSATSIDKVRLSVRPLLYMGLALYLFVLVRIFLQGAVYREGVARDAES
jgi:hypothetical protein